MTEVDPLLDYDARRSYADYDVGESYTATRFSSLAGRYRLRRERSAITRLLSQVEVGASVLDCPCGTGRWWPALQTRASTIVAADLSPGMLRHAAERAAASPDAAIEVVYGDAEALPFRDASFDWVFSYALTKHLPRPVQYRVLAEYARVARHGVLCSFGLLNHLTYEVWRRRHAVWRERGMAEAIPFLPEELRYLADRVCLELTDSIRCTTPIGVEHMCMFRRTALPESGS